MQDTFWPRSLRCRCRAPYNRHADAWLRDLKNEFHVVARLFLIYLVWQSKALTYTCIHAAHISTNKCTIGRDQNCPLYITNENIFFSTRLAPAVPQHSLCQHHRSWQLLHLDPFPHQPPEDIKVMATRCLILNAALNGDRQFSCGILGTSARPASDAHEQCAFHGA